MWLFGGLSLAAQLPSMENATDESFQTLGLGHGDQVDATPSACFALSNSAILSFNFTISASMASVSTVGMLSPIDVDSNPLSLWNIGTRIVIAASTIAATPRSWNIPVS